MHVDRVIRKVNEYYVVGANLIHLINRQRVFLKKFVINMLPKDINFRRKLLVIITTIQFKNQYICRIAKV